MRLFLALVAVLLAMAAHGQPGDPGGGTKPGVPITGIEILIGAGGAYGLKKLLGKSTRKK